MQTATVTTLLSAPAANQHISYFVAMIDYGRRGLEAQVDPEITRRSVIGRLQSGEWTNVAWVHHIHDGICEDVTDELFAAAGLAQEAA